MTSTDAPHRPRWLIALCAVAVFLIVDTLGLGPFKALAGDWQGWPRLGALAVLGYGLYLVAPLALVAWLFGPRAAPGALGLGAPVLKGLGVAFAGTAILPLGYGLLAPMAPLGDALARELVRSALLPGFAEEVLYRGLLFGLLFRFAGWGFVPAVLLNAVLFGGAHLYQGGDAGQAAMIFALTAFGAAIFAWLYVEWDFNLWVPIGAHVLMNAWWSLFEVDDTALGPAWAVGLRLASVAILVGLTLVHARRRGGRRVRGRRWWRGEPA
jgi:membrane protease YdiL (CAAX protease family)